MPRLLIIDDHPLFREALRSAMVAAGPWDDVQETDSIPGACELLALGGGVDLILLDLSLPGVQGFDGLTMLRSSHPRIPIIVVSGMDDPRIMREAMRFGAAGFVPKAMNRAGLAEAVGTVMRGSIFTPACLAGLEDPPTVPRPEAIETRISWLTPQQLRVLCMIRQGKLNKQIAFEMGVGETTVKAHVSEVLRKLGVLSRTQAAIETAALDFEHALAKRPKRRRRAK